MTERRERLAELGRRMVGCSEDCVGASNAKNGTPPRCLYLEEAHPSDGGVVVLGLNPGRASTVELQHYVREGCSYASTVQYLLANRGNIAYYREMLHALPLMGFDGNVLWTEVAKCELLCGFRNVPLEMRRHCANTYLVDELSICEGWPIVATGRRAFDAAAFIAPQRCVLGVPHPSGSYGSAFRQAVAHVDRPARERAEQLEKIQLARYGNTAVWLGRGET